MSSSLPDARFILRFDAPVEVLKQIFADKYEVKFQTLGEEINLFDVFASGGFVDAKFPEWSSSQVASFWTEPDEQGVQHYDLTFWSYEVNEVLKTVEGFASLKNDAGTGLFQQIQVFANIRKPTKQRFLKEWHDNSLFMDQVSYGDDLLIHSEDPNLKYWNPNSLTEDGYYSFWLGRWEDKITGQIFYRELGGGKNGADHDISIQEAYNFLMNSDALGRAHLIKQDDIPGNILLEIIKNGTENSSLLAYFMLKEPFPPVPLCRILNELGFPADAENPPPQEWAVELIFSELDLDKRIYRWWM